MAARPKAIIVGAGIAGLSTAWWLDEAGWDSVIIDRAPALRDGGYIVSLSGQGLQVVKRMGLQEKLNAVSYKFDENIVRDNGGRQLVRLQYKDVHGGLDSLAVCRDDLARILADELPETSSIRFDETVGEVIDQGDGVRITLGSGEIMEADLFIGADGIRSSTRERVWKDEDCLESLGYSYAVYDIHGNPGLQASCVSFNSPGHLDVLYTLRDDRVAALHIWRDDKVQKQDRNLRFPTIRRATAGGTQLVTDVIDQAEKAGSTPIIDSLTMVLLPHWSKGRVLLMGDAAHCLTLMSGQGAGMALASAEILGKELMATQNITQALAQHEKRLRPTIERLQERSRSMAAMYIPKSTLMYYVRNFFLRFMPYSWIVSWHVSSAKAEIDLTQD